MHEYSILAALLERVEQAAAAHPEAIVRRLHLKIGELAGIEVPLLHSAYEVIRERSVCDRAELAIEPVAARWECTKCKQPIVRGAVLRCAACGHAARLAAGDDIILERIEMEVPDV